MMRSVCFSAVSLVAFFLAAISEVAAQITVQQPVFGVSFTKNYVKLAKQKTVIADLQTAVNLLVVSAWLRKVDAWQIVGWALHPEIMKTESNNDSTPIASIANLPADEHQWW